MKTTRIRWIAVCLILAIMCTLNTSVLAAEAGNTSEVLSSCVHSWSTPTTVYVDGAGINITATTCCRRTVTTKTCTKCGETQVTYGYSSAMPHLFVCFSATCNGTMQTHNCRCKYCTKTIVRKVPCPGGPHTGLCAYLPV